MCRPIKVAAPLISQGFVNPPQHLYTNVKQPILQEPSMMSVPKIQTEIINSNPTSLPETGDIDIGSFDDLLDFSLPEEVSSTSKGSSVDDVDFMNMDDEFDNTEMSILYGFLLDSQNQQKQGDSLPNDPGTLSVNLLDNSPLDSLLENFKDNEFEAALDMKPPMFFETKPEDIFPQVPSLPLEKPPIETKKSRRLCRIDECMKRSRSHGLCIAHGGGRRCSVEGCDKSSQGGSLCIRHGGGKRCTFEGCNKAAQSNQLCKAHGGGPRCQYTGCSKSSQGGGFCRTHGGGKRCLFEGCTKGTQRGDFCALHGGSRLCSAEGCLRNDRGGGFCATHGGGKRCNINGCAKPCRRRGLCSAHLRETQ